MQVYQNNPHNARRIGWAELPEYCVGDESSTHVVHMHRLGVFVFTDTPDQVPPALIGAARQVAR